MKKLIALLMGLVLVFSFTACGSNSSSAPSQAESSVEEQGASQPETSATETSESDILEDALPSDLETEPESRKTLVVYFSATGNTEEAAKLHSGSNQCGCF